MSATRSGLQVSESSHHTPLTSKNLRRFTERQRRDEAHERGLPSPPPEADLRMSALSTNSDISFIRKYWGITPSERARIRAENYKKLLEMMNQEHGNTTGHEQQKDQETEDKRDDKQDHLVSGKIHEFGNASQHNLETVDYPVVQVGYPLAAADSLPNPDKSATDGPQTKKAKVIHQSISESAQKPYPGALSQLQLDVCEVLYPGRHIDSLHWDEMMELGSMVDAVMNAHKHRKLIVKQLNETSETMFPGKTFHTLDAAERVELMRKVNEDHNYTGAKITATDLSPDLDILSGIERVRLFVRQVEKGRSGETPGKPQDDGGLPHQTIPPVRTSQDYRGLWSDPSYSRRRLSPRPTDNAIGESFRAQPTEEFCSKLSDLFPPDFPRFCIAHSLNDIGAYLANAAYVISLGGTPVPDLKYGIIAVPLGHEKLLFDNSSQKDTMTPEFLQAVRDAQFASRVDNDLHSINPGEHQVHQARFEARSKSKRDIYETQWDPVIDPGAKAKASIGIKRKWMDNPVNESDPDSQAVAVLSGPARGKEVLDADTNKAVTEVVESAGDNEASARKQTLRAARRKSASRSSSPQTKRNVQAKELRSKQRVLPSKKKVPASKKKVPVPEETPATHVTRARRKT